MLRRTALILFALLMISGCGAGTGGPGPAPDAPGTTSPGTTSPGATVPGTTSPDTTTPGTGGTTPPPTDPQPAWPALPPVPDGAQRQEAGLLAGTGYYADIFADRLEVHAAATGAEARKVATIPVTYEHAQTWTHLSEGSLVLIVTPYQVGPGGALYRIDLGSGKVTDLGAMVGPTFRLSTTVSSDNRYLAAKLSGYNVPLDLIDLQTGKRAALQAEAIPMGAVWSLAGSVAAARAAEPDSGLPAQIGSQYWDGATHIDLINAARILADPHPGPSGITHLRPPRALALVDGPVWSPDGNWLAVSAGTILPIGKGPGGGSQFEATEIWLVEAATNRWLRLGDAPMDQPLTAWPPTADRLIK